MFPMPKLFGGGVTCAPSPDTRRELSPSVFRDIGAAGQSLGVTHFDDFHVLPVTGDEYTILSETGFAESVLASNGDGIYRTTFTATNANSEFYLRWQAGPELAKADFGVKPWAWEVRFALSSIADDAAQLFLGLAEAGLAADGLQTDTTGVIKAVDHMAFRSLTGDGDGLDSVYGKAAASTVHTNEAQVMVATTYYKAGIRFDGTFFHYYINGDQIGARVLGSTALAPDDQWMTMYLAAKTNTGATAFTLDFDWWAFAQAA